MQNDNFDIESEKWDNKELGASAAHAKKVSIDQEKEMMEALNMKLISLRLHDSLIQDLKFIAKSNGIGYQPLIREVLTRFVTCEKKVIMRDTLEQAKIDFEKNLNSTKEVKKAA